jgi:Xaa-Pro aminopeptidase
MESPADITWTGYSLAERDRRWTAVRKNAAEAGFDCIFVPLCVDPMNLNLSSDSRRGVRSDGRYLTQLDNAAVVLPTDGRPPIVINDRGRGNAWVPEVRAANQGMRGSWGPAMAQALLDLGMERARIGVAGLKRGKVSHVRANDGVVNHSSYMDVVRRLPNAAFEDGTDVVGFARFIKGAEEIACFRRAVAIADAGVDEMAAVARPGVDAAHLYARVTTRMLELGSERHDWALYIAPLGEEGERQTDPPLGQRLRAGDWITNEVSATWGSQLAQEDQPILLGPVPDAWKPVIELQRELWNETLARMTPGTSFGDLIDFIKGFGERRNVRTALTVHGRGLGNEGPILTPATLGEGVRDVRMERGNTFVWKPSVRTADGKISYVWAGDVLVTERGAEKLSRRPVDMISITS